ncbi:MAG: ribosomal protein S18-alanine N-acetyltransferase [Clostridia bacterium]|nr:ribosomal protein S18-alanine N-acetyltransferase [Clostridia bacterium]
MNVTAMDESHVAALATLEALSFADPWSETALREELANPCAHFLVAERDGRVVGYVGCHHMAGEGYITNVAVHPDCRRQGVARQLLQEALLRWQHLSRVTLEVRVSNAAAIALYEGLGFVCEGVRPRFYAHPTEDAAIYSYYKR